MHQMQYKMPYLYRNLYDYLISCAKCFWLQTKILPHWRPFLRFITNNKYRNFRITGKVLLKRAFILFKNLVLVDLLSLFFLIFSPVIIKSTFLPNIFLQQIQTIWGWKHRITSNKHHNLTRKAISCLRHFVHQYPKIFTALIYIVFLRILESFY